MSRITYFRRMILLLACLTLTDNGLAQANHDPLPVRRIAAVPAPGITGDFDHFAVDENGGRLFLAGEDHKTLEVFELKTGRHIKSIAGFGTPFDILSPRQ